MKAEYDFSKGEGGKFYHPVAAILSEMAEEFHIPEDDLIRRGVQSYLERQLRMVQVEIFEITSRYNVSSVGDMEER